MAIRKVKEELAIDDGKLVVLYIEENKRVLRYRYLFAKRSWNKNEWVRLDHTSTEPSHAHIRRNTAVLKYVKSSITNITLKLADLSDKVVENCRVT